MISDQIIKPLKKASGIKNPDLQFSSRPEFGDYTTNIALSSKNPRKTAEELVEKLKRDKKLGQFVDKIDIAGPGFINFHLSTKALSANLSQIIEQKEKYGRSTDVKSKKVIVEYSSPNIAKPFTIGHLRSTISGDAIANILEARGAEVFRDNHLGDWGTQFGKQIYAIKTWGNETEIENSPNPVKVLVALYIKFHEEAEKDPTLEDKGREWFKKLEDGDSEARRLWQKCVDWSFNEFNKIYKELEVKFTENEGKGYGESYFEDKMTNIINELEDKKLLKKGEEGAKLVFFENDKYPPLMIMKKDGTTIEKLLGWYKEGQRIHIGHGHFRFKEGKMSTRRGNAIWLEDVLNEAVERATKLGSENEALARKVGIGAIKYNDLKRDYKQDILFDWDEVLNMQGNSGPYLQYTYARAQSVLLKSEKQSAIQSGEEESLNKEELLILRDLIKFPEVIEMSADNYSPNILCEYLFNLAQNYNTFYNKDKIIAGENEEFRLALTFGVGQALKNGLHLLGIETPEKM